MLMAIDKKRLALKAKLFRGFGDSSRLSILEALLERPMKVGEIVEATGLSQPNASNHLGCLRDCGLVVSEQRGRNVIYRLSDDRVGDLLQSVDTLLADVARGVFLCTRYNLPLNELSS
jgi:DNA-binding transcriptional ArsR family regulator